MAEITDINKEKAENLIVKYNKVTSSVTSRDGVSTSTQIMNSLMATHNMKSADDKIVSEVISNPEKYKPDVVGFFRELATVGQEVKAVFNQYLDEYKRIIKETAQELRQLGDPRFAVLDKLRKEIQEEKIQQDMKKEADITASHNLNNHMAKKAETGEKEKKVAPKENAPQKTAATEQKVKEPKAKKAKEEKVEKPKAETKVEKPAAEKKEEKVKAPAQEKTAEQAAAPKEKEKLANGQTLDFSRVFQMTHIDEKPYGLKAIVDGVPLGTKVLSKEEQNAYFEKKITPAQLVSQKFERELKPENFAQIKEYAPYKIPTAAGIQSVNTFKGEKDGKDMISIKTADDTWRTRAIPEKELKDLDNKVATKEQVAAKLFSKEIGMEVFKAGKLPENLKENIEKIRVFGLTNKNPGDNTKNYGVQAVMKDGRTTPTRKIENNEYFAITGSKAKDIKPTATRENAAAKYLVPDIKAMLSQSQEQKKGLSR